MSGFDDFMNDIGANVDTNVQKSGGYLSQYPGIATSGIQGETGVLKPNQDNSNAQGALSQGQNAYSGMTAPNLAPINPQYQGASGMAGVTTDPTNTAAQKAQMAALSNLAANGGRNAASDANLASIQANENANAKGQAGAIDQQMAARGMSGSGNALLAKLSNSQNATNNQSAEDLGVRGQEASTALQAGQGAAAIGSNMENQQFGEGAAKAQAQDAINRYNSGVGNSSQEYNSNLGQTKFGDTMGIAAGNQKGGQLGTDYWTKKYGEDQSAAGGMLGGATKGIGALAAAASTGGKVPGQAAVPGDSTLNDFVPITTSPGEVVVPRTLAKGGSPKDIATFVKNPPKIQAPGSNGDKEAMLSALRNIKNRRAA